MPAVGGGELTAVDVVEHIDIDEVQPAVVLVEVEQRLPHPGLFHLAAHTLVGSQVVEAAHADLVGHRPAVLTVIVDAATTAHLPRGKVVQAGGVVVAVGTAGLVVGIAAVDVGTDAVQTVYLPRQTQAEDFPPASG